MPYINVKDENNFFVNESPYAEEVMASLRGNESRGDVDLGIATGVSGYAELFETTDKNAIDCGYFVTLHGSKIRKANSRDKYILGVTTAAPAILGSGADVRWKNKYVTDEWGKIKYDEVMLPEVTDTEGNMIVPQRIEHRPRVNPAWDKEKNYIPRALRPEWAAVNLIGQTLVRDDGTCRENGFCVPNDQGMATAAARGYRVMERRSQHQILILIKTNAIYISR
jgi:hypothetical protein